MTDYAVAVILSSHALVELERVADYVVALLAVIAILQLHHGHQTPGAPVHGRTR